MPDEPLFALVELLSRRHALAVFWLLRKGSATFVELESATGSAPAQLAQRVRELRAAGLIEVNEAGDYRLTSHGRRLLGPLEALSGVAEDWARLTPRQRTPRGAGSHGRGEPT